MTSTNPIISIADGQQHLLEFARNPRAEYQNFALKRHLVEAGLTSLGLGGLNVIDTDDRIIHYQDKDGIWKDRSRNELLVQLRDPSFKLQSDFPEGEDKRRETVLRTFEQFDQLCSEHDGLVDRSREQQWSWRTNEENQGMVYFYFNILDESGSRWHSLEEIQRYIDSQGLTREQQRGNVAKEQ